MNGFTGAKNALSLISIKEINLPKTVTLSSMAYNYDTPLIGLCVLVESLKQR
jgi:hypothetical protein